MENKPHVQPKCKYCDIALVADGATFKLARGSEEDMSISHGRLLTVHSCPRCGYTELFTR